MDNKIFVMNLEENKIPYKYIIVPDKSHIEMIKMRENSQNLIYNDMLDFIKEY